ncbi:hypothetical protein [Spiroplasma cantharicola]|uniref:Uncharacterized protein n=1 Tax=Spiroplasma cantharicola TaxID=362837 RepID=A0A0M3SJK3_9MOLU|nr:hypothetical protein [Spiroplasma cantharicola]ALD66884.1 hypothetical protein SCANT_v1c09780 [Spiroplasma cantharicola]
MSFTLSNVKFFNKKLLPKTVNFKCKDSELVTVISQERYLRKNFKNVLEGKYLVKSGIFKINQYDMVNKQWTKKKVATIGVNKFFRKWPEKFWLYTSLLLNRKFLSKAKINYIDKKYSYLSFSTSKNNKTDLEMRDKVESMISKFINNSVDVEEQWLSEFLEQIVTFNNKNLEKSFGNLEDHIKIIIRDYYLLIEKNQNLELIQTFLQTLWDKVYSFMELSSLCTCEYNTKKVKDRKKRKLAKELNFRQTNFVTRKQLKILDLKVNDIKRKISKTNFIIKNLKKQILFELDKSEFQTKKVKNLEELFNWRKASEDQRFEFKIKQEKMFFEGLSDEANTLRGKIVEVMHRYHKKVLNDECEKGNLEEFKEKKAVLKKQKVSIYKQSLLFIDETAKELGFEFSILSLKFNRMEEIWFQLLTAIYLKKYNIIFYNVFSKLNQNERNELLKVINNLVIIDSKFSIIFVEESIYEIPDLSKNIYLITENDIVETSFEKVLEKNWTTYGGEFFAKNNRFNYKYDGKKLYTMNESLKIQSNNFKESGQIIINPMKVATNKKENGNLILELNAIINSNREFLDANMYEVITKENDLKLYFYSIKKYNINEKVKLYISDESILKVV